MQVYRGESMRLLIIIYLFVIAFTYEPDMIPIGDWSVLINYAIAALKTTAKWWLGLIIPYLYILAIANRIEKNLRKI